MKVVTSNHNYRNRQSFSDNLRRFQHTGSTSRRIAGDETPVVDPPADPKPFDPSSLSAEAKAYVDKQRTNASKTAAKNAREKLMNDDSFISSIRQRIEEENALSVEEKLQQEKDSLNKRENELLLKENTIVTVGSLMEHGMSKEQADNLATVLTVTDGKISASNVDTFLTIFDDAVKAAVTAREQQLIQNGYNLNQGNSSNAKGIKEQYAEAVNNKDTRAQIRLKREALKEGIQL